MIRLLLATRNAHKMREFSELLGRDFLLEDLRAHPQIGEIVEKGATFLENARIKALTVSRKIPGWVVADDSGLEVDSLGGAPGVFSARYAGEKANDAQNREKVSAALQLLPENAPRTARFRCVLVWAENGVVLGNFEGVVEGRIVRHERGHNGFGYDPIFQPNDSEKTFAEISSAEKNALSHRAAAARLLRAALMAARKKC